MIAKSAILYRLVVKMYVLMRFHRCPRSDFGFGFYFRQKSLFFRIKNNMKYPLQSTKPLKTVQIIFTSSPTIIFLLWAMNSVHCMNNLVETMIWIQNFCHQNFKIVIHIPNSNWPSLRKDKHHVVRQNTYMNPSKMDKEPPLSPFKSTTRSITPQSTKVRLLDWPNGKNFKRREFQFLQLQVQIFHRLIIG